MTFRSWLHLRSRAYFSRAFFCGKKPGAEGFQVRNPGLMTFMCSPLRFSPWLPLHDATYPDVIQQPLCWQAIKEYIAYMQAPVFWAVGNHPSPVVFAPVHAFQFLFHMSKRGFPSEVMEGDPRIWAVPLSSPVIAIYLTSSGARRKQTAHLLNMSCGFSSLGFPTFLCTLPGCRWQASPRSQETWISASRVQLLHLRSLSGPCTRANATNPTISHPTRPVGFRARRANARSVRWGGRATQVKEGDFKKVKTVPHPADAAALKAAEKKKNAEKEAPGESRGLRLPPGFEWWFGMEDAMAFDLIAVGSRIFELYSFG